MPCKLSPVMKTQSPNVFYTLLRVKSVLTVHLDHIKGKKAVVMTYIRQNNMMTKVKYWGISADDISGDKSPMFLTS